MKMYVMIHIMYVLCAKLSTYVKYVLVPTSMGQHNVYVPMLFITYNKCVAENNFPFIIFLKCLFI